MTCTTKNKQLFLTKTLRMQEFKIIDSMDTSLKVLVKDWLRRCHLMENDRDIKVVRSWNRLQEKNKVNKFYNH